MTVQFDLFLASSLDRGLGPGLLTPAEKNLGDHYIKEWIEVSVLLYALAALHPRILYRRMSKPQNRSGRFGEEINVSLQGTKSPSLQHKIAFLPAQFAFAPAQNRLPSSTIRLPSSTKSPSLQHNSPSLQHKIAFPPAQFAFAPAQNRLPSNTKSPSFQHPTKLYGVTFRKTHSTHVVVLISSHNYPLSYTVTSFNACWNKCIFIRQVFFRPLEPEGAPLSA